jgi:hypothetical protein
VIGYLEDTSCPWVEELEALWDVWNLENIKTLLVAILYEQTGWRLDLESLQILSHERRTRFFRWIG